MKIYVIDSEILKKAKKKKKKEKGQDSVGSWLNTLSVVQKVQHLLLNFELLNTMRATRADK